MRRGHADALHRVAIAEFLVGLDRGMEAGAELSIEVRHRARGTIEARSDGIQGARVGGSLGNALRQEPAEHFLARAKDLSFVAEVAKERAAGEARALGDLGHGGLVVALLGEEVEGGHDQPLARAGFPSRHAATLADATRVASQC